MEILNIKAVEHLSGLNQHTLRAWEKRYQAIAPRRAPNGRRVYTMVEVERLRLLRRLSEQGHAISGIAGLPDEALRALLQAAPSPMPLPTAIHPVASGDPAIARTVGMLLDAVAEFRLDALGQALTHARFNFNARTLVMEILSPLLVQVGEAVAADRFSIAQEHALSAIVRDHLGQIFQSLKPQTRSMYRAALSTPEGDLHEFGILLSAVLCSNNGVHADYLGPNLPAPDLALAAIRLGCSHVIVGATALPAGAIPQPLHAYLTLLDANLPANIELWIGGSGVVDRESLTLRRPLVHLRSLVELDEKLAGLKA